jgi:hypothetical protein
LILKGLFGGPDRDRTDDLFHAMEARSQLRHRPTDKLALVYTSQARQLSRRGRSGKFFQWTILTAGLSPDAKASSIAEIYTACARAIGMWRMMDAGSSKESSQEGNVADIGGIRAEYV